MTDWLKRASDLLAEDDPGPTPFLVADLLVEGAIAAIQGPPKVGKTWALLELACAIVTGREAFGRFEIPKAGPVIVVLEESGEKALHRRLDALTRGHAVAPERLSDLHFAANLRVRLDDRDWQLKLIDAGRAIQPRAIFLDPLARLKTAGRDENAQKEMAPLLDFMRDLRSDTGSAVAFVHHSGHQGTHLRGSSDLEAYWESKLTLAGSEDKVVTLTSEHREAEAGTELRYRLAWDDLTRSIRLEPVDTDVRARVAAYLRDHPEASGNEVAKALGGRKTDVLAAVRTLKNTGGSHAPEPPGTTPSGSRPASGSREPLSPVGGGFPEPPREELVPEPDETEVERLETKHADVAAGATT